MLKRLLIAALLSFVPLIAAADDVPVESPPAETTAAPTPAPSATPTPDASSALGPASTSGGAGGSTADASALQPAGGSPLQPTSGDAAGLTAPSANTLQMPATSADTLRVLAGEADGGPIDMGKDKDTGWSWLWFSLLFGILVATGLWFTRNARWARPWHRRLRRFFDRPEH